MIDTKMLLLCGTMLVGASLAVPATAATSVAANTFRFVGACTDCYGGNGDGTATLVLAADYKLGEDVTEDNFVSFTYDGTDLQNPFVVTDASMLQFFGGIAGPLPDTETFGFYGPDALAFNSFRDGSWCVGFSCTADYGGSHLWSQLTMQSDVPEPATWAMMIVGFGVAGASLRRRGAAVRVAFD